LVERTGGTIKAETAYRWHFNSTAMLDAELYGFERYFNEHRPYKAMGGKTPAQLTQECVYQNTQTLSPTTLRSVHNLVTLVNLIACKEKAVEKYHEHIKAYPWSSEMEPSSSERGRPSKLRFARMKRRGGKLKITR